MIYNLYKTTNADIPLLYKKKPHGINHSLEAELTRLSLISLSINPPK